MTTDEAKAKYIELQKEYGDVSWFLMLALMQDDPIEVAHDTTSSLHKEE